MRKHSLKSFISDTAGVPKDVILGVPILRMIGCDELYIENYRGILEYTNILIRIQTKIGQIHLHGKNMEIIHYTNDEMKVIGEIENISYHRGGAK